MAFNGIALGAIAAGGVLVYAGVKGYSVPAVIKDLITGQSPQGETVTTPITGQESTDSSTAANPSVPGSGGGNDAQNQALGQQMAAAYGWGTGAEWDALNWIVEAESGWSDTVVNPTSGAAGIAQDIQGWSSSYQKGNAAQQIAWLLSYIKSRYGDPIAAKAFHEANGWY